jgi:hypothetical protein
VLTVDYAVAGAGRHASVKYAPADSPHGATIEEYGIYAVRTSGEIPAERTAKGSVHSLVREDPELIRATSIIAPQLGMSFGFRARVDAGPPGSTVADVRLRVTHPPITNPRTGVATRVDEWDWPMSPGVPRYTGWRFDEPSEMVEGPWTMQVVGDGRVLAEQNFQVLERSAATSR